MKPLALFPALVALSLVACQTHPPAPAPIQLSVDVSALERREDPLGGVIYTRPGERPLAQYAQFLLLPVEVKVDARGMDGRSASDRARLELYFFKAVSQQLSAHGCRVTSRPAPSTLAVRLIVMGITAANNKSDPISGLLLDVPFEVVDATIEAQFLDSQSGELQAVSLHRLASQNGLITDWDSAHTAFDLWAQLFGDAIDAARTPSLVPGA